MIGCLGFHAWKVRTDFDQEMDFSHPYTTVIEVGLVWLSSVVAI
jgi:hypothetical protein